MNSMLHNNIQEQDMCENFVKTVNNNFKKILYRIIIFQNTTITNPMQV